VARQSRSLLADSRSLLAIYQVARLSRGVRLIAGRPGGSHLEKGGTPRAQVCQG
jgi:hypothetical protein